MICTHSLRGVAVFHPHRGRSYIPTIVPLPVRTDYILALHYSLMWAVDLSLVLSPSAALPLSPLDVLGQRPLRCFFDVFVARAICLSSKIVLATCNMLWFY